MAWVIFGFGFVVIALAVAVALGKGGEMQAKPVIDTPRGRIPEGAVDAGFLEGLVLPRRTNGYATAQVDRYLADFVAGTAAIPGEVRFDVAFRGYDMGIVDSLLDRMERQLAMAATATGPDPVEPPMAPAGSSDEAAIEALEG